MKSIVCLVLRVDPKAGRRPGLRRVELVVVECRCVVVPLGDRAFIYDDAMRLKGRPVSLCPLSSSYIHLLSQTQRRLCSRPTPSLRPASELTRSLLSIQFESQSSPVQSDPNPKYRTQSNSMLPVLGVTRDAKDCEEVEKCRNSSLHSLVTATRGTARDGGKQKVIIEKEGKVLT